MSLLVCIDERVSVVSRRTHETQGRGAWLHLRHECVVKAVRRKAFSRAFKANVTNPSVESLLRDLGLAPTPDGVESLA